MYKFQIVYSTHSPHFVGLNDIENIRLLKKKNNNTNKPKITEVHSTNITKLCCKFETIDSKYSKKNITPRLHATQTPEINEGFFSKGVVLVEGRSDKATILGASKALRIDLESKNISVISCSGKNELGKTAIVFQQMNIPTYGIWDNDERYNKKGKDKEKYKRAIKENEDLLKIFEEDEKGNKFPSYVHRNNACIKDKLETMLENEIGVKLYNEMLCKYMVTYGLNKEKAIKNPIVISQMFKDLKKKNIPDTLKKIIQEIKKMVEKHI